MNKIFLGQPSQQIGEWCKKKYPPAPVDPKALCFTAQQANSTVMLNTALNDVPIAEFYPDMNFQYSTDGNSWTVLDLSKAPAQNKMTLANVGDKVYFKAVTSNPLDEWSYGDANPPLKWQMTGKIAAAGSVQYLLKSDGSTTAVPAYAFCDMFSGCTALTQAPALPATMIDKFCYMQMFSGCTSLTVAPELPAATMANRCYMQMFSGCTALTQAPALPATMIDNAEMCYNSMFEQCQHINECHMKVAVQGVYDADIHGALSEKSITIKYDL